MYVCVYIYIYMCVYVLTSLKASQFYWKKKFSTSFQIRTNTHSMHTLCLSLRVVGFKKVEDHIYKNSIYILLYLGIGVCLLHSNVKSICASSPVTFYNIYKELLYLL